MPLETRIRSRAMRLLASAGYQQAVRRRARLGRRLRGRPPAVHYFHQVDDPYSHLAVQKLDALRGAYRLPFQPHLVSAPAAAFRGSAERFEPWALRDALSVAADYGVSLPASAHPPEPRAVQVANGRLAPHLADPDFAARARELGDRLWTGETPSGGDVAAGQRAVARGDHLRQRLGHYQGGMFWFDGEWYWGVDRLRLLEARLIEEGYGAPGAVPLVAEPRPADATGLAAAGVTLEYFPSLRSPYTAVGHARVLDLIERSGITVQLRPVMPMMMRGVPAPGPKQRYIITDAAREGRAHGAPLGRIVDPIGEPVRRAFALFPGAVALDAGMAFVTAYLDAAWRHGVDIARPAGLRRVARDAGLDWPALEAAADAADWQTVLEDNLQALLDAGLWGVPSFRVSGGTDAEPFACWGQDRIWRVEREIVRRARQLDAPAAADGPDPALVERPAGN